MKDYTHLEGKIIDWVAENGFVVKAIVALIEYDIGITLVLAEDTEYGTHGVLPAGTEMSCLNGPHSPHGKWKGYKTYFYSFVAQIKRGKYDSRITQRMQDSIEGLSSFSFGRAQCAFK